VLLSIEHRNIYHYNCPVECNTHRLMLRPLEGHDVNIHSSSLVIQPTHRIRWKQDVLNNSIALVDFTEKADQLLIESHLAVEQFNLNPFDFILEMYVQELPFEYHTDEAPDLAPYRKSHYPEDTAAIREWLKPFLGPRGRTKTLEFLINLNQSVPMSFRYQRREESGVQTPAETLKSRSGSCRDFALLFMEAARHVGLAARFVSGYLCGDSSGQPEVASDATHAWTEIYLPGAGWKGFDPTCGTLAAGLHVRVAVAREPSQATPIRGAFLGPAANYLGMEVKVKATTIGTPPEK